MKTTTPTCFISYCHHDIDRDTLDYMIYILKQNIEIDINLLFDQELKYGADFKDFMSLLDIVDSVIILMTPQYKKRILKREGGVYEEYTKIIVRDDDFHKQAKESLKNAPTSFGFELIPVLFSGEPKESVPDELTNRKYLNIVGFRVNKNNKNEYFTPENYSQPYLREIKNLAHQITASIVSKGKSFEDNYNKYFSQLFLELKSDWNNPKHSDQNYVKTLFVKTSAYKKVESQASLFFIGRKGSGKSTLADVLAIRQNDRYLDVIGIITDEVQLEFLYTMFHKGHLNLDTKYTFPRQHCFEFSWHAFFYILAIYAIARNVKKDFSHIDNEGHTANLKKYVLDIIPNSFEDEENDITALFTFAYHSVERFIDKIINESRSDEKYFYSDLMKGFSLPRFIDFIIGKKNIDSLANILDSNPYEVLITLDGFDSAYDNFRRNSIKHYDLLELRNRTSFEIDWLRAILTVVIQIRSGKKRNYTLIDRKLDFCITIPDDRFLDVQRTERDSYKYQGRFQCLDWTGMELALLLRKRLEQLCQVKAKTYGGVRERLFDILSKQFKHLPESLEFQVDGRIIVMPLFLYVLRHTCWRPREILLYYASILAMGEDFRKLNYKITTEMIRSTIKATSYIVIRDEFLNEFSSTILNIENILQAFHGKKQSLDYTELSQMLLQINFDFALNISDEFTIDKKIMLLYKIGFLGIKLSSSQEDRLGINIQHAFYFNEGGTPFRGTTSIDLSKFNYVIHPMFSKYLQLETSSQELILEYNWDYIKSNEVLIHTTGLGRIW